MRQITVSEMKTLQEDPELLLVQVHAVQIKDPDESDEMGFVVGIRALFAGDPTWRSIGIMAGADRSRSPGPKIYRRLDFVISSAQTIFLEKAYNIVLWLKTASVAEPLETFIQEFQLDERTFGPAEKVREQVVTALRGERLEIARNRDTADA